MNFAINGYTKEYISLKKDGIGVEYTGNYEEQLEEIISFVPLLGKKELLEYEIQMWEFFVINSSDASEVEIRIVFRRFIMNNEYLNNILFLEIFNIIFLELLYSSLCCS